MAVGTKSTTVVRKSFSQQAISLLWEIVVFLFNYVISWIIVVCGLLVVYWPQIQSGNAKNVSIDIVFQGIGITVILYGLNRLLKKSIGLNSDNEQRKRDEKILSELSALRKLIEENNKGGN